MFTILANVTVPGYVRYNFSLLGFDKDIIEESHNTVTGELHDSAEPVSYVHDV